jgi:hypothetical protein
MHLATRTVSRLFGDAAATPPSRRSSGMMNQYPGMFPQLNEHIYARAAKVHSANDNDTHCPPGSEKEPACTRTRTTTASSLMRARSRSATGELAGELAGDDRPGEGYLAKAGRLTAARHQAEEIIRHEHGPLTSDDEDDGGQARNVRRRRHAALTGRRVRRCRGSGGPDAQRCRAGGR